MVKYRRGEAFIDILNAHGVDKIFINSGGDVVDVQSDVALARVEGRKAPQLVLCLDESVAASAAYGHYMVTGKPQVIMVHSELGTLQLGGNMQNLHWGRVPALILAGYQPSEGSRTAWDGKPYDQGGILRGSVKYDRCLKGDEDFHEAFNEALRVARTEPTGPVYLSFPMPYMKGEIDKPEALPPILPPQSLPAPDRETLEKMADILLAAKNPMLVSGNAGRYPENVEKLVSLAETLCAMTLTGYSWMNFPSGHPLCLGIEQIGGSRKEDAGYGDADAILVIDYAMPYVSSAPMPKAEAKILHIDVDPLTSGRALWRRGADIFMKADAREAIPALTRILKDKITPEKKAELDERFRRVAAANEGARKGWVEAAAGLSARDPISPDYLFHCVNQLIGEDAIFVNHTLGHCASVTEQILRTKPGTWFGCPSGMIGWATGAALGAASAAPGKLVVTAMTDGGFVWGCPTSTYWTAANYGFPFLTIICNNDGYGAIRDIHPEFRREAPPSEGFIAETGTNFRPDYAMIARGAGAYGRTVTKPGEVRPALEEALEAVRGGRPAVLDVYIPEKS
ncbi:MAG: thiamine pyrophosphate-binding protein [Clostridiales bacterium]|nr:thiamine pyrophosphate-binding protein [Clostridiales bacterium]